VRLGEPDDTLVLAEGIETALAAWALTGIPAWATISAHGLEKFTAIPRHVKKVIICADNDASFTGQAAAFQCAKYMKQRARVETEVWMPPVMEMDMLDAWVKMNPEFPLIKWKGNGQ
jgi:putative DNA primase/helicase